MTTTTSYGTWANIVNPYSLSVENTALDAFGTEGPDGYDLDGIVNEYRDAINDALPDGVSLNGDEFYGPYYQEDCHFDGYPVDELDELDIKAIVDSVDFWAIAARHETV
jgi:hypothetical protein